LEVELKSRDETIAVLKKEIKHENPKELKPTFLHPIVKESLEMQVRAITLERD
jgi:hypothetical protein